MWDLPLWTRGAYLAGWAVTAVHLHLELALLLTQGSTRARRRLLRELYRETRPFAVAGWWVIALVAYLDATAPELDARRMVGAAMLILIAMLFTWRWWNDDDDDRWRRRRRKLARRVKASLRVPVPVPAGAES